MDNSHDKFLRQILVANSHGKFPQQILRIGFIISLSNICLSSGFL